MAFVISDFSSFVIIPGGPAPANSARQTSLLAAGSTLRTFPHSARTQNRRSTREMFPW